MADLVKDRLRFLRPDLFPDMFNDIQPPLAPEQGVGGEEALFGSSEPKDYEINNPIDPITLPAEEPSIKSQAIGSEDPLRLSELSGKYYSDLPTAEETQEDLDLASTPLTDHEDVQEHAKPISINSLDEEQERVNAAGPSDLQRGLTGAAGISSTLQEILAKRGAKISGKDPATEIEQIRKSQERLDKNIKDKEGLRALLQEKLNARRVVAKQKELDRASLEKRTLASKVKPESEKELQLKEDNNAYSESSQNARDLFERTTGKKAPPRATATQLKPYISAGASGYRTDVGAETAGQRIESAKEMQDKQIAATRANILAQIEARRKEGDLNRDARQDLRTKGLDAEIANDKLQYTNSIRTELGLDPIPEGATYRDLKVLEGMEASATKRGQGVTKQGAEGEWNESKAPPGVQKHFNRIYADLIKAKNTQISKEAESANILNAASSETPMGANAAQRLMAIKFNKGALSENDVQAFTGSKTLLAMAERWIGKKFDTGTELSPHDLVELTQLAAHIIQNEKDFNDKLVEANAEAFANLVGDERAGDRLRKIFVPKNVKKSPTAAIQTPKNVVQSKVEPAQKTIVKREYSASRNQTRLTYSDNTTEVVSGRQ